MEKGTLVPKSHVPAHILKVIIENHECCSETISISINKMQAPSCKRYNDMYVHSVHCIVLSVGSAVTVESYQDE